MSLRLCPAEGLVSIDVYCISLGLRVFILLHIKYDRSDSALVFLMPLKPFWCLGVLLHCVSFSFHFLRGGRSMMGDLHFHAFGFLVGGLVANVF